jgi:hypothetical protein
MALRALTEHRDDLVKARRAWLQFSFPTRNADGE